MAGLLLQYVGSRLIVFSDRAIIATVLPWLWLIGATLAPIGLWTAALISIRTPSLYQFAKYGLIGAANTAVSLTIVNALSQFTGIEAGLGAGMFVVVGFLIANTHSFFWNKHWTFVNRSETAAPVQYIGFLLATAVSTVLAAGIVSAVTHFVAPPTGFTSTQWLNAANLISIAVALAWNFFAYKFIVFRTKRA
ncbi:GtrA family protein [Candidatus Parcubacteria bacterium]|nr:GtrA family protein [Candidatus Parcubacteria bacterium]